MLGLRSTARGQVSRPAVGAWLRRSRAAPVARQLCLQAEPQEPKVSVPDTDIENPDSEAARKAQEIQELKAQEKFMMVGTGEADCLNCGYHYSPSKGDPEFPVAPGTKFQDLPQDWNCPVCGADAKTFQVQETEVAGFAVNQGYGLGTNSMTAGQKSLLIYGSLALFFALFLAGYFLE
eukprot:jgi/Ulvmu1/8892/UM049_0074.1